MFIPDLSERLYVYYVAEKPFRYLSVGWLGDSVPSSGKTSEDIFHRLENFASRNYVEDDLLGWHTCEICGNVESHGQFFIEAASTRYLIPMMIFHYIRDHSYKLPEVVEAAVLCPANNALQSDCPEPGRSIAMEQLYGAPRSR